MRKRLSNDRYAQDTVSGCSQITIVLSSGPLSDCIGLFTCYINCIDVVLWPEDRVSVDQM